MPLNVAIIGAGLSGLACAHRLTQLGVTPRVFEEDREVGGFFPVAEALLEVLYRPVDDPLRALAERYDLYVHPQQSITRFVLESTHERAVLEGFRGFVLMRGRHPDSLERQMARQVEVPIEYGPTDLRSIARESDYVVVATGDPKVVSQVQPWYRDLSGQLAVATIHGSFLPREALVWFGRDFAPEGYGFLLPWSGDQATLSIAVPEHVGDVEVLWQRFLPRLDFDFEVDDVKTIHNFQSGHVEKNRIGNFLFVGNAGGTLMPFMGFGIWDSLLSGFWAAEAIVQKKDFNRMMRPIAASYRRSLGMRRLFARLHDPGLDRLVRMLGAPLGQWLVTRSRLDVLKWAGTVAALGVRDT